MFLLFFGFGWGKPVQFDPYNLKNPRKDAALISLAGPISNLLMASLAAIIIKLLTLLHLSSLSTIGLVILYPILILNVSLGIFNLLPINPLDGFKIVGGLLSEEKAREWYQLERYGMIFLILLIIPLGNSSLLDTIIRPIISAIINFLAPSLGTGII
jgi:Zn-dependent protease